MRELSGNLNGALAFQGGGGSLDNNGLDLILGDTLEEVFHRVNPFSESDSKTKIKCVAGAAIAKKGIISIAPGMVMRTMKMDIALAGSVNMLNEKLDITFTTRSRKGIGISAGKVVTPYLKIGGTMANPLLVLDPKGVVLSGSAVVATAGLSILAEGMWDRWVATAKNP